MTDEEVDEECRRARIHELMRLIGQPGDWTRNVAKRLDELGAFKYDTPELDPPTTSM